MGHLQLQRLEPNPSSDKEKGTDDEPTKQQIVRAVLPEGTTATARLIQVDRSGPPSLSSPAPDYIAPLLEEPGVEDVDLFPAVGERLLHFHLEEELGRGAFARVYLARQESLANRHVVLKLTTVCTDEPQTLARLRHTNIVPVYSVHQAHRLQAVCMPYLGRTTLGHVLSQTMTWSAEPPAAAKALLAPLRVDLPGHELQRLTYVEGCLWVIGQLAAGLGHAHARGVLHQDLKPANVLVTDDGVPMILDFNVASDGGSASHHGRVGGTLPYMSPEHLAQFLDPEAAVDERSDLFSLGVILYQMLTGCQPFPSLSLPDRHETIRRLIEQRSTPFAPVRKWNPAATPAVEAIVAKLLRPNPGDRYPSAEALRTDITRQLEHRPLAFAPDRSVRERADKWRRRNPRLATGIVAAAAVLLLLIIPAAAASAWAARSHEQARQLQHLEAAGAAEAAVADLRTAAIELGSLVDPTSREHGMRTAKGLIEKYGVTEPGWDTAPAVTLLSNSRRAELRSAFAEALVLLTRAEAAAGGYSPAAIAAAVRWNTAAFGFFPGDSHPAVLDRQRRELQARSEGRPVPPLSPSKDDAAEHGDDPYFDGLDLAAVGRYREGLAKLTVHCERHPGHFRAWYARGICHDALGQPADAAAAFGICVALQPESHLAVANRGIARLNQGRARDAEADFTRALDLKPDWVVALLNRGIARAEQRRDLDAETDFSRALEDPAAPTRLYFLRSRARSRAGNRAGADADRREGLSREPHDPTSWTTRGYWRMHKEPAAALADFDAALKLDPTHREALMNKAAVLADVLRREGEAVPVLDEVLSLNPDNVEARAGRGVYLARLGRVAEARRDAETVLAAEPTAYRKYQAVGLYAQLSAHDPSGPHRMEALRLLAAAFRGGFDDKKLLLEDHDLDPIRSDPEFARIVEAAAKLTVEKPAPKLAH
jgi:serine/threonine protein kinase/tetratricopeptide (TPR) repeat protein